jgi:hypothetical protein
MLCSNRNYFFFSSFLVSVVVVAVCVVSAGAAGLAVSAAGAGAGVAVVVLVVVVVESVLAASPLPLPHDATKRPNERASTLNFTNFIILFFRWLCQFIPLMEKGNPVFKKYFFLPHWP